MCTCESGSLLPAVSDSGDDRIPAGVSGCLCVGVARRLEREKDGQRRGYSSAGPSLSGSGPGEKTRKKECAGRRRGIKEGERFRGDRRMASWQR